MQYIQIIEILTFSKITHTHIHHKMLGNKFFILCGCISSHLKNHIFYLNCDDRRK